MERPKAIKLSVAAIAAGKMNCNSFHTKSPGHRIFGDAHYKFMKKR